jgi:hypothetical protein
MISCGSETRNSSGGTMGRGGRGMRGREVEVLKTIASEKRQINFLSQPMKVVSC